MALTDRSESAQSRRQLLNEVRDDKTIKAVVLRIDSPGGEGLASDIIWRGIESLKAKKPVVVSMGDVAASGGYYIACNANKIVAQPSTVTGSIGVVGGKPVVKGFYDWIGVSNEYVLRGTNAGIFRESEKFTDSERAKFQEFLKSTYDDFTVGGEGAKQGSSLHRLDRSGRSGRDGRAKKMDWSMSMAVR